mmetsp:Transcript_2525/g.7532  ORF Transcript_2525/g.7532 Transcript_2525/m.7532 type:complete len:246 (+) Transcript_2525:110-847(+)
MRSRSASRWTRSRSSSSRALRMRRSPWTRCAAMCRTWRICFTLARASLPRRHFWIVTAASSSRKSWSRCLACRTFSKPWRRSTASSSRNLRSRSCACRPLARPWIRSTERRRASARDLASCRPTWPRWQRWILRTDRTTSAALSSRSSRSSSRALRTKRRPRMRATASRRACSTGNTFARAACPRLHFCRPTAASSRVRCRRSSASSRRARCPRQTLCRRPRAPSRRSCRSLAALCLAHRPLHTH